MNNMRSITRNTILFSVVVLMCAYTAATVFAQPPGMGMEKNRGYARYFVEPIFMGHGFAFEGDNVDKYLSLIHI